MTDIEKKVVTVNQFIREINKKKEEISSSLIAEYVNMKFKPEKLTEKATLIEETKKKVKTKFTSKEMVRNDDSEKLLREHIEFLDDVLSYKKAYENKLKFILILFIVILSVFFWFIMSDSNPSSEADRIEQIKRDKLGDKYGAWAYTKIYVENHLKSPSSADFPFGGAEDVQNLGNGLYSFSSYVDAKNSFGVPIRTYFSGKIQKVNGGWKIVEFRFEK